MFKPQAGALQREGGASRRGEVPRPRANHPNRDHRSQRRGPSRSRLPAPGVALGGSPCATVRETQKVAAWGQCRQPPTTSMAWLAAPVAQEPIVSNCAEAAQAHGRAEAPRRCRVSRGGPLPQRQRRDELGARLLGQWPGPPDGATRFDSPEPQENAWFGFYISVVDDVAAGVRATSGSAPTHRTRKPTGDPAQRPTRAATSIRARRGCSPARMARSYTR